MKLNAKKLWQENKVLFGFLLLMIFFRSAVADWSDVPTGSMEPTIQPGDRIWVDKLAYDIKIPLTGITLYSHSDPKRGDIVVFDSEKAGKRLVKRIIGLPGDIVALRDDRLYINGEFAEYGRPGEAVPDKYMRDRPAAAYATEHLKELSHPVRIERMATTPLRSFGPVSVPENHFLVLGDNRDNSADSRVYGFVPRGEISGRATRVIVSLDYDKYFLPRTDRLFYELP